MKEKISLVEALTGVEFNLTHLDGKKIRVKSNPGDVIKPNSLMTLKEMGLPFHKKSFQHGNLYILFRVEFPKTLK